MARIALTPLVATRAGIAETLSAVDAGLQHSFDNTLGDNLLIVKNGGASPITVTLKIAPVMDGAAVTSKTVSVAAGAQMIIGPFPTGLYNQSDQAVYVDFSASASVTVAALRIP